MKKQILKICGVLLTCISLPLQARSTEAIPDSVYNGLPFPMKKVVQPQFPDYKVCITDFGATPDGKTLNTQAINNAIATVSQKGGGTVVIPAGFWITGPIKLQSGVNLYTERNAFVLFTEDHSHYKNRTPPNMHCRFLPYMPIMPGTSPLPGMAFSMETATPGVW